MAEINEAWLIELEEAVDSQAISMPTVSWKSSKSLLDRFKTRGPTLRRALDSLQSILDE